MYRYMCYMYMYLQACAFIWYMCMHMCAFYGWCAVTWDSTGLHACVAVLINDVILCIPLLLATVQTHYSYNTIQYIAMAKYNHAAALPVRCPIPLSTYPNLVHDHIIHVYDRMHLSF